MCTFVAYLIDEGLQHTSIKGYLSAIRRLQIVRGLRRPICGFMAIVGVYTQRDKTVSSKRQEVSGKEIPTHHPGHSWETEVWGKEAHLVDNIMLWGGAFMASSGRGR